MCVFLSVCDCLLFCVIRRVLNNRRPSRDEKDKRAAATFFAGDPEVDGAAAAVPPYDVVSQCV